MNRPKNLVSVASRFTRQAAAVALIVALSALSSPAMAAGKKKEVEVETKSYTMPYLIVIMLIGGGLMAICRPSRRADKPDDKAPDE
jgi:hypothetical protein